ncbi:MAG: hypothetical protein FWE63_00485 [Bacteroidales bacterium]|nr:hypothetical protein [Bacteroidales bacterium]
MKKKTTTQPRIEDQAHYYKVGRLRKSVAEQIRRVAADIYISENYLKHIFNRHKKELEGIGITPKVFVDLVVSNFNRIYKGTGRSILLVLWNGKPKVVAVELNFALKKEFYEVKTATVMRKEFFNDRNLLWKKE